MSLVSEPPEYKYRSDDLQYYLGNGEGDSQVWSIPQIIVITLINIIKEVTEKYRTGLHAFFLT